MLKKVFFALFGILILSNFKVLALADPEIKNFDTQYRINRDGSVDVTEFIEYNFNSSKDKVMVRKIPVFKTSNNGEKFRLTIENIQVSDNKNNPYIFNKSTSNGFINIQIGDQAKPMTGIKNFVIKYNISGGLSDEGKYDEFFWNATGSETGINILSSTVLIKFPEQLDASKGISDVACFTGTTKDCTFNKTNTSAYIKATRPLQKNEGLSFSVKFTKGITSVIGQKRAISIISPKSLSIYQIAFIVLFICVWYFLIPLYLLIPLFKERLRLLKISKSIIFWHEPPKDDENTFWNPTSVAYLIGNKRSGVHFITTVLTLAQKGYLTINISDSNKISFVKAKVKGTNSNLTDSELVLMEAIFGVFDNISEISLTQLQSSRDFYIGYLKFKHKALIEFIETKVFKQSPKNKSVLNILLLVISVLSANILALIALLLININFRGYTKYGYKMLGQATSLKKFLLTHSSEIESMKDKKSHFEKFLPYSVALGVENTWIAKFKSELNSAFPWYIGDDFSKFSYFYNKCCKTIEVNKQNFGTSV